MKIGDYVLIKVGKVYKILGFCFNFTNFYTGHVVKMDSNSKFGSEVERIHIALPTKLFFNKIICRDKIIDHKLLMED